MINKKIWNINLPVLKGAFVTNISPKQYDTASNLFKISLYKDMEKYDLTGLSVQAVFKKADGTISYLPCTIANAASGELEVDVTSQVLAIAAEVECEIRVTGTAGELLIAPKFYFKVYESLNIDGAVQSQDEFPVLVELLNRVETVESDLQNITPEQIAQVTTNEQTRQNQEAARQAAEAERAGFYAGFNAQLNDKALKTEVAAINDLIAEILENSKQRIVAPTGFNWEAPINIYRNFLGAYSTDFDITKYKNVGGVDYYVDVVNGLDTNDGLTLVTALKNIQTAIAKTDIGTLYVADGQYNKDSGFKGIAITKNLNIIGLGENILCDTSDSLTNFLTTGSANIYRTTRTAPPVAVYDKQVVDENGDYTKLTFTTDLAIASTTPGSYYLSGTSIFVHPADSRVLTGQTMEQSGIVSYTSVKNLFVSGNVKVYLENLNFEGGTNQFANTGAGQDLQVYTKNCKFKYSNSGEIVDVDGATLAVFENCLAARAREDGFSYHALNGTVPKAIEINCEGRHNGYTGDVDNGSTMHEGGSIIRLNGKYHHNLGPNIADVSPQNRSWNVAVEAYNSLALTKNQGDFFVMYGPDCKMWNEACKSYGSPFSAYIDNGNMYNKDCDFSESNYIVNGGTLSDY